MLAMITSRCRVFTKNTD